MSLFRLTNQYRQLLHEIEDNPEMDPEVARDTVEAIEENMNDKYDHIWTLIKSLEAEVALRDEYVKQSQSASKSLKNKINSLKAYAIQEMVAAGKSKVKTDHYTLSIRKSHKVEVTSESLIPKEFLEAQSPKIKKKKIAQALKNGEDVPGARYVENQSIQGR